MIVVVVVLSVARAQAQAGYYPPTCDDMGSESACRDHFNCAWCTTNNKCGEYNPCDGVIERTCPDNNFILSTEIETCSEWESDQISIALMVDVGPVFLFFCYWIYICTFKESLDSTWQKLGLLFTIFYTLYVGVCCVLYWIPSTWAALQIMAAIPVAFWLVVLSINCCCLLPIMVCCDRTKPLCSSWKYERV